MVPKGHVHLRKLQLLPTCFFSFFSDTQTLKGEVYIVPRNTFTYLIPVFIHIQNGRLIFNIHKFADFYVTET